MARQEQSSKISCRLIKEGFTRYMKNHRLSRWIFIEQLENAYFDKTGTKITICEPEREAVFSPNKKKIKNKTEQENEL